MAFPNPTIIGKTTLSMPVYVGDIGAGTIVTGAGQTPTVGSPQFDANHTHFYALTTGHGSTTTSPGVLLVKVDVLAATVLGTALLPFPAELNRSVESPLGLCLDSAGNVYVATTIDNSVTNNVRTTLYKYDANLNFLGSVVHDWDQSTTPEASLDASDGTYMYAIDQADGGQYVVAGGGGTEANGGGAVSLFIWNRATLAVVGVVWISVNFFFTAIWVDRNNDLWATGYTSNDNVRHLVHVVFNSGGIVSTTVLPCPVANDPLAAWYSAADHSVIVGIPSTLPAGGPTTDPPFSKISLTTQTVTQTLDIPHATGGSYYMVESGNRWRDQTGTPQMVGVQWVDTSVSPWPASIKAVMVDSNLNLLDVTHACYGVDSVEGTYVQPSFNQFTPATPFSLDPAATCLIEFTFDNVNNCVWTWQPASEHFQVLGSFTTVNWERFCFPAAQTATATLAGSPTVVAAGGSTVLTFGSQNGASATLTGVGTVPLNGTVVVSPTTTTTYVFTVTGPNGSTTASVTIEVINPLTLLNSCSPQLSDPSDEIYYLVIDDEGNLFTVDSGRQRTATLVLCDLKRESVFVLTAVATDVPEYHITGPYQPPTLQWASDFPNYIWMHSPTFLWVLVIDINQLGEPVVVVRRTGRASSDPVQGAIFDGDEKTYYPSHSQPGGVGTPTFPQETLGEMLGTWVTGCGHYFNNPEVVWDTLCGQQVALICCPVCRFISRIISPGSLVYQFPNDILAP